MTLGRLSKIWKCRHLRKVKGAVYKALVVPTLAYGSECWTLKKDDERKLHSLEMNCLRRMIGVSRRDRKQNTVVRERTNATESIIEEIRRRRLSWFGHISRMEIDRLPARALYCHVTGERSQGRQAKKWIKNVKEDFELRNIQFKDAIASCRQNCMETAIINLIVIVMTDEKKEDITSTTTTPLQPSSLLFVFIQVALFSIITAG